MSKIHLLASVFLGVLFACGPTKPGHSGNGSGSGTGPDAWVDNGSGGSGSGSACATSTVKAESTPLDIFVMLDQSSSMNQSVTGGGTKWTAVTSALKTFVQQPSLMHMSIGMQFFGQPASSGFGDSCVAADYSTAAVEIAALPGVSSAIVTSMGAHSPTTSTPTSAALQGAVDHAKTWATAHSGDSVVVVLATDGDPTECDTTLANINAIAAAAKNGTPKILTFVIGVGASLTSLNGIAAAGGTTSAFIVDTGGNTNQQFLDAMNAIQHTALGCQYSIPLPQNGPVDYTQVNIQYTPGGGGAAVTIPNVPNQAACPANGNGWYYDNPTTPTQIILCTSTCGTITADLTGEVDIALGCATVIQ